MVRNASSVWEIRVNGPNNESLLFLPMKKRIRGEFDYGRVKEPFAVMMRQEIPETIPGQCIGIDIETKTGYIYDPISERPELARLIAERGLRVPPPRQEFHGVNVVDWVHYMKRAVEAGLAQTTKGSPPSIDGEPTKSFFRQREPSKNDRLAAALDKIADKLG